MAAPAADTTVRLGLVGTGADLVKAIEALKSASGVEIAVVADASDRSEGAKLAQSLKLPLVKNAMEVFRTKANLVLEVNGDERAYERLLSIKPPGTEVMSVRGARILINLIRQGGGGAPAPAAPAAPGAPPKEIVKEVIKEVPVEVVKEVVREVIKEVPVEVVREVIKEVPVEVVREVIKEVPVEIIREIVKEVPVEVPVAGTGTVEIREIIKEVPVEVIREIEVVREVIKEVPVEVIREIVKEVPIEVVKEVPVEVVKEVPVEGAGSQVDQEELRRLRRRVEELQSTHDQIATMSGTVTVDEKMQSLLTMAAGVGHIFNNVLAGILGRTQLLLKRAERDKHRELVAGLSEIETATRTGIDALTRIQEFSRTKPSEAPGRVDLNDIVQRAVEQSRPKWRDEPSSKGVRIEVITHFGAHTPVTGMDLELLECLIELLSNAVDAMPRGGTLTIRTGNEAGRGWVSVADTGVGMAEAVQRRVFEPFFSTKGETGLGLGLAAIYGSMVRHGGEVGVESAEGKGTTITLRVPTVAEGAMAAAAAAREADRAQLLVVDDDETVRTALADMLRGAGYAVTLAASGLEGIAKVRERTGPYDLVVTDLGMPDVPGWEVVEAVKQVEGGTPVVIMSGFDRARATRRAKELGVDLVISKPFDLQDFLNTVRGLLVARKR